ncbi:SDR family NAD(P)-dependent oxidoreductase [Chelatococcus reniformis]|uniref:NAD(P)-dependent dehydrogenase n=1 Tax=Chelatococcus reniformis TaxID=1494448 RepID=A0A916UVU3_9HYPH|nr:SDR family oxidoreductase [Chelatococcus reniformis]GGC89208.1 NAD(P)-dependent dehydrogenase [Chelatococcus reniformis]
MDNVCIVTGSSQGVGQGIAKVFLDRGHAVLGTDIKAAADELSCHARYVHHRADLRTPEGCEQVVAACLARFGRIDALVNNAGLGNARPFDETTEADYARYYDINVGSVLTLTRLVLPHLKTSGGAVVNIASAFGLVGAAGSAAYVPTKYAVVGITRMLATEFGRDGIRVNAVAPGLVWSPGTDERIRTDAWWQRMMIEGCPLGRVGQPEEIGEACFFLASPSARFITGVVLPVDGGWSIAKFLPRPR